MKDERYDAPTARERLVDRVWADFHQLQMRITAGLDAVLEANGVSPEVVAVVDKYVEGVVEEIARLEAGVVRLAGVPGAENAGYELAVDRACEEYAKSHGHDTLKSLFAEIRADREASKAPDAHVYGKDVPRKGKDGMER